MKFKRFTNQFYDVLAGENRDNLDTNKTANNKGLYMPNVLEFMHSLSYD